MSNPELKNLLDLAYKSYNENDSILFRTRNKYAFDRSIEFQDTLAMAEVHWHYGLFFSKMEILDSAYYHYFRALNYYELKNHEYYKAKMFYNLGFIQSRLKDYLGAEENLFKAILVYKNLNKNEQLYFCYRLLGSIFREKNELERALEYHLKAFN
ncbi:MAG: hypothetical protein HRU50_15510, partial [Winogradskyella sp.]|uniref:hypothetical protein n=1 Tax=Winogradskyella sp. TaxID=1883156 RepID=UPI0025E54EBF